MFRLLILLFLLIPYLSAQSRNIIPHAVQHEDGEFDPIRVDAPGVLVSTKYDFTQTTQTTQDDLTAATQDSITLLPCPSGINGTNTNHWVYLDDADNSPADEAVVIEGGTCTSDAPSGTILVTSVAARTGGDYTVRSATAGIQEAVWTTSDTAQKGGKIFIPSGTHTFFQALSVGNGTATISAQGTDSTLQFLRLIGAGSGEGQQNEAAPFSTQLKWSGPAASTMVTFRGPMEGSGLENMKLTGMNTLTGTLLETFWSFGGRFSNLMIGRGGAGSTAVKLHVGSNDNYWERIVINNNSSLNTSGLFVGDGADPTLFGISQNVFNNVVINFTGNEPTNVGLVVEGADNNTFIQLNVFANAINVTNCTNATPIVVTTNIVHDRTTADNVRIVGVTGNLACNGNYAITVVTTTTFSLDTSVGNGAYVSGGAVWGPGHAVEFDQVGATVQPASNVFINPAFQRGFFTSLGNHSDQWFFPMSTGDGTVPTANTSTARSEFNGFGRAMIDSAQGTVDNFGVLMGKLKFVKDDNITGYAKFYPATGEVAIGDIDGLSSPDGELEVRRSGTDARMSITGAGGSDDAVLELESNKTYQIRADRTADGLQLGTVGTPGLITLRDAADDRILNGATEVLFSVTHANLPATENGSIIYCSDCTRLSVPCTASGSGSFAKREAGAWNCD